MINLDAIINAAAQLSMVDKFPPTTKRQQQSLEKIMQDCLDATESFPKGPLLSLALTVRVSLSSKMKQLKSGEEGELSTLIRQINTLATRIKLSRESVLESEEQGKEEADTKLKKVIVVDPSTAPLHSSGEPSSPTPPIDPQTLLQVPASSGSTTEQRPTETAPPPQPQATVTTAEQPVSLSSERSPIPAGTDVPTASPALTRVTDLDSDGDSKRQASLPTLAVQRPSQPSAPHVAPSAPLPPPLPPAPVSADSPAAPPSAKTEADYREANWPQVAQFCRKTSKLRELTKAIPQVLGSHRRPLAADQRHPLKDLCDEWTRVSKECAIYPVTEKIRSIMEQLERLHLVLPLWESDVNLNNVNLRVYQLSRLLDVSPLDDKDPLFEFRRYGWALEINLYLCIKMTSDPEVLSRLYALLESTNKEVAKVLTAKNQSVLGYALSLFPNYESSVPDWDLIKDQHRTFVDPKDVISGLENMLKDLKDLNWNEITQYQFGNSEQLSLILTKMLGQTNLHMKEIRAKIGIVKTKEDRKEERKD